MLSGRYFDPGICGLYWGEGLTTIQSLGPRGMDKMVHLIQSYHRYVVHSLTSLQIQTGKGNTIIVRTPPLPTETRG
jgi:hypothetical protein